MSPSRQTTANILRTSNPKRRTCLFEICVKNGCAESPGQTGDSRIRRKKKLFRRIQTHAASPESIRTATAGSKRDIRLLDTGEHLFHRHDAGNAAVRLCGQARGAAGEAHDLRHLRDAQVAWTLAERKEAAHGAAAEDVARAGGIHDVNALRRFHRDRAVSVRGVAALRTERGIDERNAVFREQLLRSGLRRNAPEEVDFFVADLHDVRLTEAHPRSSRGACADWGRG